MNFIDKLKAKKDTYQLRIKTSFYRGLQLVFPAYFDLNKIKNSIFPLGYSFPEELFQLEIPEKKQIWAEVIPGFKETYRFSVESDYYQMYQDARFAFTWKKGGWDCLRHYEIIANGCFPIFRDLEKCPDETLTQLYKKLLIQGKKELIPWKETSEYKEKYNVLMTELIAHSRKHATCMTVAEGLVNNLGIKPGQKILFLTCNLSPNYSRELVFIGLNRFMKNQGGICISYPRLEFLYDSYPEEKVNSLYGRGFGYARKLRKESTKESLDYSSKEIKETILNREWDFIVYGKIGTDEGEQGEIPGCPFWEAVSQSYSSSEIVFVYGGDHLQDLGDMGSIHSRHLWKHAQKGKCFVRELRF